MVSQIVRLKTEQKIIGLFGDSFGYQHDDAEFDSWVDQLERHFDIINHCQCGVGEYKILQQLEKVDLTQFDYVIILHTSFLRVFVADNPLHTQSKTHQHCDIIYADIADRPEEFAQACRLFYKHIFDEQYARDIYNLICKQIDELCSNLPIIHVTNFDHTGLYKFPQLESFYLTFQKHRGNVNHYNKIGNQIVFDTLIKRLQ
jgi:hypothetical protein